MKKTLSFMKRFWKFYYLPVYLGILCLVLTLPLVVLKLTSKTSNQQVVTQATQDLTTASIFPQKANYSLQSTVPMGVIYESNDQPVRTLSVVVTFDPSVAQVTEVAPGILMDNYLTTTFDNKIGQVIILAENATARPINGILASVKFQPKKEGLVDFGFASQTQAQKTVGAQFVIGK